MSADEIADSNYCWRCSYIFCCALNTAGYSFVAARARRLLGLAGPKKSAKARSWSRAKKERSYSRVNKLQTRS